MGFRGMMTADRRSPYCLLLVLPHSRSRRLQNAFATRTLTLLISGGRTGLSPNSLQPSLCMNHDDYKRALGFAAAVAEVGGPSFSKSFGCPCVPAIAQPHAFVWVCKRQVQTPGDMVSNGLCRQASVTFCSGSRVKLSNDRAGAPANQREAGARTRDSQDD